jgi:hypothetical protein
METKTTTDLFVERCTGNLELFAALARDVKAILDLDPNPREALYKKCDQVLKIPAGAKGGGIFHVIGGPEALFVIMQVGGPVVLPNAVIARVFSTAVILGLVLVDNDVNLVSTHLLPCWQEFNLVELAHQLCREAVASERRASGL